MSVDRPIPSFNSERISPGHAFLGIDLGTTNIKAQIVAKDGTVAASGACPVAIHYSENGAAEQDIEEIWTATTAAVKQAVASAPTLQVRAIGVSSQGGALQVLNREGTPVGRVIGWQDVRGGPWDRALTRRFGSEWFVRHTGHPKSDSAIGQLQRLREQGALPEDLQVGWVGDIVVGRLCGRRAHDATSLSEARLYNPSEDEADGELLALLGIRNEVLPALLPPCKEAGGLFAQVAVSLGLTPDLPVGPAVHDQYAAATGCGVVRPGDTMFGAGTAWALVAVTERLEPPVTEEAIACRHPVQGRFGQMLSLVNGGACISWAEQALNLGHLGVREIDAMIATVQPGSAGLRFRPLLSEGGGASLPPGEAGCLTGLRLAHTPAHILRALVEGLACELGRYLGLMAEGGVVVRRLVMCGKAAASEVTPGIIADTTGLPVDCVAVPDTSSLGAAVLARGLVEPGADLAALADEMKPPVRRVEPGPGAQSARAILEEYIGALRVTWT